MVSPVIATVKNDAMGELVTSLPGKLTGAGTPPTTALVHVKSDRELRRNAKYNPEVMWRMRCCVAGECELSATEREASCTICSRGLHSLCAGLPKANLAMGVFTCGDCMVGTWMTASNFTK